MHHLKKQSDLQIELVQNNLYKGRNMVALLLFSFSLFSGGVKIKIGIGLSCFERYDLVSINCKFLANFLEDFKVVVADDGSIKKQNTHGIPLIEGENRGVAINKNRLLYALQDCDLIFIIEDDVRINNLNFIEKFRASACDFASFGPIESWPFWKIISKKDGLIKYITSQNHKQGLLYTPGSFTALSKYALDKIGGLNCEFSGLGLEHMEWAYRAFRSGLSMDTLDLYQSIDFSNDLSFFDIPRNKRSELQSKKNELLYFKLIEEVKPDFRFRESTNLFMKSKIFGIGLSKTGTNSLNESLNQLGFKSIHFPLNDKLFEQLKQRDFELEILEEYQAITDITVVPFYKQLFRQYPSSKFILTCRDLDKWIISMKNHWKLGHRHSPIDVNYAKLVPMTQMLLQMVYGGFDWDDDKFKKIYNDHLEDVDNFFLGLDDRLLKFNICEGDGWEKLCSFLNKSIPLDAFPYLGKRNSFKIYE